MSDSALRSLEETMRKLETAMKSPMKSPKKSPRKRTAKKSPPKRKPPTPGKKSRKLTAKEKHNFIHGSDFGSVKSLNQSIKFMRKENSEYREALMNVKKILEDEQDINKCIKVINSVL